MLPGEALRSGVVFWSFSTLRRINPVLGQGQYVHILVELENFITEIQRSSPPSI